MTFRDAKAIAEAVQRPTMKFVAIKTADHPIVHRLIIAGIDKAWTSDGQRPKICVSTTLSGHLRRDR
jgi:hypothetical protein